MLYSCSTDKTARAWIMEYGECIKVYRDHTHSVTCIKYLDGYSKYKTVFICLKYST